jgi:hypothetical protein
MKEFFLANWFIARTQRNSPNQCLFGVATTQEDSTTRWYRPQSKNQHNRERASHSSYLSVSCQNHCFRENFVSESAFALRALLRHGCVLLGWGKLEQPSAGVAGQLEPAEKQETLFNFDPKMGKINKPI